MLLFVMASPKIAQGISYKEQILYLTVRKIHGSEVQFRVLTDVMNAICVSLRIFRGKS
jgi:hypothetical protein